jgi:maltose O-acetyltransferase
MADVGRRCVIGAGSVVTQPIPDDSVAVGSPAKVVRQR